MRDFITSVLVRFRKGELTARQALLLIAWASH